MDLPRPQVSFLVPTGRPASPEQPTIPRTPPESPRSSLGPPTSAEEQPDKTEARGGNTEQDGGELQSSAEALVLSEPTVAQQEDTEDFDFPMDYFLGPYSDEEIENNVDPTLTTDELIDLLIAHSSFDWTK